MLSILIPTYNYNVFKLVATLHKQAVKANCIFEILIYDDASTNLIEENKEINTLTNCTYKILPKNIGRSAIRNLLAKNATFNNLLFLDADVSICSEDFLENYLSIIQKNDFEVVYGGIVYQESSPNENQLLRWVYGKEREALNALKRNTNTYVSFLTLNFLIKKHVFDKIAFDENIPNLRYEDLLFSYHLMLNNIKTVHIDNQVVHDGIETSSVFLNKTDDSLKGLLYLLNNQLLPYEYAKISKTFALLKKVHAVFFIKLIHSLLKPYLVKNLLSKNPSLFVYDVYRLGYLSTL